MPVPHRIPAAAASGAHLALSCARNVHASVDRAMPEATALLEWLARHAGMFGLPAGAVPGRDCHHTLRLTITAEDWRKADRALQQALAALPDPGATPAQRWIDAITRALDFNHAESRLLSLVLQYRLDTRMERLLDQISDARGGLTCLNCDPDLFALLLGLPVADIYAALRPDGHLLGSGIIGLARDGELGALVGLSLRIRQGLLPGDDLHDQLLGVADPAKLPWEAFGHLGREAQVAADLLWHAVATREPGVNLLLHGAPGTGKTTFAAALAEHIGAHLRPVAEADEGGNEPDRTDRLCGLRLAQRLAEPGRTLLLFDEADDVLVRRFEPFGNAAPGSTVFLHRMLERMPVPVIWTTNHPEAISPAVLRRMAMCVELKQPDLPTRALLWQSIGRQEGIVFAETEAAHLARLVPTAPALAASALRGARLAGGGAETAQLIVEGIARAVNRGAIPAAEQVLDATYDPALINADADLAALTEALLRPGAPRAVSFLLSGPPGAGKSAWVRHLAARMGLGVMQKRASDLLDMYVGGTEKQIAATFAEARAARAFLVFDEADSLLGDRREAMRGWEVSQVNEMLTWMEQHDLPFACTTNLEARLDPASWRRFLVKLRFDWLTPAQARAAFPRFFALPAPAGLAQLRTLTPADFALVRRRATLLGTGGDAAGLLAQLAAECEGRVAGRLPVGFAGGA